MAKAKRFNIENDKGRATCIIEENRKEQLISQELSNTDRYSSLTKDDIDKVKININKELATLRKENIISADFMKSVKQITPTTPIARPTLKAHKDPIKVRLIINTQGSAFYKIAKFVSKELKPLTTTGKSYIKDTEEFVRKIKGEQILEGEKLISFDIVDMYPSLPITDVLKEVIRRIKGETFQASIKKEGLIKLAQLSVAYNSFQINGKFYKQAEGLFIGSPASPAFAEIFVQRLEEISIYTMIHAPRVWLRKVDDTFVISKHSIQSTLNELNKINNNIQFTAEEELDKRLQFLDCQMIRRKDGRSTKRKLTQVNILILILINL